MTQMKMLKLVDFIDVQLGTPLEEQLGCYGYFGFGSGFALGRYGAAHDTGALYCNRCPQGAACWQRHRDRVRGITPALCQISDEVGKKYHGEKFIVEFLRASGQGKPREGMRVYEPYTGVMMGNTQDGAQLAIDGRVTDRERDTLTWPLVPLT